MSMDEHIGLGCGLRAEDAWEFIARGDDEIADDEIKDDVAPESEQETAAAVQLLKDYGEFLRTDPAVPKRTPEEMKKMRYRIFPWAPADSQHDEFNVTEVIAALQRVLSAQPSPNERSAERTLLIKKLAHAYDRGSMPPAAFWRRLAANAKVLEAVEQLVDAKQQHTDEVPGQTPQSMHLAGGRRADWSLYEAVQRLWVEDQVEVPLSRVISDAWRLKISHEGITPPAAEQGLPDESSGDSVEVMLADTPRVLVRGVAGSGKSSLLRWLALHLARRTLPSPLASWGDLVPVLVPARQLVPTEPAETADPVTALGLRRDDEPEGWTDTLLARGRAVVLIDGLDEVPAGQRDHLRTSLVALARCYPHNRYIATTRPLDVPNGWLAAGDFVELSFTSLDRRRSLLVMKAGVDHLDADDDSATQRGPAHDLLQLALTPRHSLALAAALASSPPSATSKEVHRRTMRRLLEREHQEHPEWPIKAQETHGDEALFLLAALAERMNNQRLTSISWSEAKQVIREVLTQHGRTTLDAGDALYYIAARSGFLESPAEGRLAFISPTIPDVLEAADQLTSSAGTPPTEEATSKCGWQK
ncbi:NACHT domain-containing protein [Streptomyces sp. NPDC006356]